MKGLILFIVLVLAYYALKSAVRSALRTYHQEGQRAQVKGEEMVLDPECRTYIIKDRAVTKRIAGTEHFFCSEACARRFEDAQRR